MMTRLFCLLRFPTKSSVSAKTPVANAHCVGKYQELEPVSRMEGDEAELRSGFATHACLKTILPLAHRVIVSSAVEA